MLSWGIDATASWAGMPKNGQTSLVRWLEKTCMQPDCSGRASMPMFFAPGWRKTCCPDFPPVCVIVMETSLLKCQDIQGIIVKAEHVLEYLSAYSPDLNPFEHKWAQSKALRRKFQCSIESFFSENTLWIVNNWLGYIIFILFSNRI